MLIVRNFINRDFKLKDMRVHRCGLSKNAKITRPNLNEDERIMQENRFVYDRQKGKQIVTKYAREKDISKFEKEETPRSCLRPVSSRTGRSVLMK